MDFHSFFQVDAFAVNAVVDLGTLPDGLSPNAWISPPVGLPNSAVTLAQWQPLSTVVPSVVGTNLWLPNYAALEITPTTKLASGTVAIFPFRSPMVLTRASGTYAGPADAADGINVIDSFDEPGTAWWIRNADVGGLAYHSFVSSSLTIYVDSTAGDDDNDGLGPTTAIATMAELCRRLRNVVTGSVNVILLAPVLAGDTFSWNANDDATFAFLFIAGQETVVRSGTVSAFTPTDPATNTQALLTNNDGSAWSAGEILRFSSGGNAGNEVYTAIDLGGGQARITTPDVNPAPLDTYDVVSWTSWGATFKVTGSAFPEAGVSFFNVDFGSTTIIVTSTSSGDFEYCRFHGGFFEVGSKASASIYQCIYLNGVFLGNGTGSLEYEYGLIVGSGGTTPGIISSQQGGSSTIFGTLFQNASCTARFGGSVTLLNDVGFFGTTGQPSLLAGTGGALYFADGLGHVYGQTNDAEAAGAEIGGTITVGCIEPTLTGAGTDLEINGNPYTWAGIHAGGSAGDPDGTCVRFAA